VIAAQSIGEPGTQLTMRTFHIGGTHREFRNSRASMPRANGIVRFVNLQTVKSKTGDLVVMNRQGSIAVVTKRAANANAMRSCMAPRSKSPKGGPVQLGQALVEWDPYTFAILTEIGGTAQFKDLQEGITLHEEVDEVTGLSRHVVADSPDEKRQPAMVIKGKASKRYLMPSRAHLMVQDGDTVFPGDVLAKIPRETTKTKDSRRSAARGRIVRSPQAARNRLISEIDGVVRFGEVAKGQRKLYVAADNGTEKEYSVPRGVHINVQEGERVKAGEPLMDGPLNPHDILAVLGEKELQSYLVNEIQEVYRLQGVNISTSTSSDRPPDDALGKGRGRGRHEVPARRASGQVRIPRGKRARDRQWRQTGHRAAVAARDHEGLALHRFVHLRRLLPGDDASAHRSFHQRQGRSPARPEGERDRGRLIPAGTGMEYYRNVRLSPEMEEAASKVQEEVSQAYEDAERALELMRHEGETEELAAE